MFTKLGRDEVLMGLHMHWGVSAISAQGWIQGRAKIDHGGGGVPYLKKILLQTGRLQQQNWMHSNDLEAWGKMLFLVQFWSQIFDVFLDLVIFVCFNAISIGFYGVKCFICLYFVWLQCLWVGECLYNRFKCLKNLNEFLCIYLGKEGGMH